MGHWSYVTQLRNIICRWWRKKATVRARIYSAMLSSAPKSSVKRKKKWFRWLLLLQESWDLSRPLILNVHIWELNALAISSLLLLAASKIPFANCSDRRTSECTLVHACNNNALMFVQHRIVRRRMKALAKAPKLSTTANTFAYASLKLQKVLNANEGKEKKLLIKIEIKYI